MYTSMNTPKILYERCNNKYRVTAQANSDGTIEIRAEELVVHFYSLINYKFKWICTDNHIYWWNPFTWSMISIEDGLSKAIKAVDNRVMSEDVAKLNLEYAETIIENISLQKTILREIELELR